jgi:hypothetical protein
MSAPVKPCELPCEKCGHSDIYRVFRAAGSTWHLDTNKYARPENRYASALSYLATTHRDHIDHTCRCCGYRWQALPMRKPRKTRPTPEAKERT